MPAHVRLAQMFDVSGFSPTRASVYLKRSGKNPTNYFDLAGGTFTADATNFSGLTQGVNKINLFDVENGYTGNGYMAVEESITASVNSWPSLDYAVRSAIPQGYFVFVRGMPSGGRWHAFLSIDGEKVDEVEMSGLVDEWQWFQFMLGIPDAETHNLTIQLKVQGSGIDKLHISEADAYGVAIPAGEGPDLTTSPYVTLHLQIFTTNENMVPSSAISVYDWKTTISEVITDDWYNFDTSMLNGTFPGDGSYALVMSSSGGSRHNFVVWEMLRNDEYTALPSAIKV